MSASDGTRIQAFAWLGLLLALPACERERPTRVTELDQILAAVPDSAMRERWRDAAARGQLPPLGMLPVPETALSVRVRPPVTERGQPGQIQIPQGAVAAVRPRPDTVMFYRGGFQLTDAEPGRIAGTLDGRTEPIEILYRLPDNAALADPRQAGPLTLMLNADVVNGSMRRLTAVLAAREPLLLHLSDGGRSPWQRAFEELPLQLRQLPPAADGVSGVAVTWGREQFTLRPGERRQASGAQGRLEFFLLSSYWTPPAEVETAEGDAYHVQLLVYRLAG